METGVWRGPAEVLENRPLTPGPYRLMLLRAPEIASWARPGQFMHILCPLRPDLPAPGLGSVTAGSGPGAGPARTAPGRCPPGAPMLRRPFTVHDADAGSGVVSVLFQVVGPGTESLSRTRPGETLDLIGPLGKGCFPLAAEGPAVLVGGGAGVAPFYFLARRLLERQTGRGLPVKVLVGIPGADHLGLAELFQGLGDRVGVLVASESAAPGTTTGLVTDLLERVLEELLPSGFPPGNPSRHPVIYACGPWAMLIGVARLARKTGATAWISTGEHMACGVGACRGCAVPVRGRPPYRLSCRDGPVFDHESLDWERIALTAGLAVAEEEGGGQP